LKTSPSKINKYKSASKIRLKKNESGSITSKNIKPPSLSSYVKSLLQKNSIRAEDTKTFSDQFFKSLNKESTGFSKDSKII